MTTDAKIGLLLALVFIVGITFVINGLPDFLNKNQAEPDTIGYINHYKQQTPALVGKSRDIATTLSKPVVTVVTQPEQGSQLQQTEVVFQPVMPAAQEAVKSQEIATAETVAVESNNAQVASAAKSVKPLAVYEVRSGDSLANLAVKYYGKKEGSKQSSIEKIFNANRDKLSSVSSIQVGQKLTIPAIENKTEPLVQTGMFEKVAAEKELKKTKQQQLVLAEQKKKDERAAAKAAKEAKDIKDAKAAKDAAKLAEKEKLAKEQFKVYTIKEADSLWQIAVRQLGDGNRFREILKLNKDAIGDGKNLTVGTKIKLPAK